MPPFATHSIDNEWALLLACASPNPNTSTVTERLHVPLDWHLLLNLAEEHSVLGLLAQRLQALSFQDVPPEAREKLQARMRAQHLFTLSMTAELFQILNDFSATGIQTILVKGPVISLLAYGDSAIRSYVDLDLLVRHSDILTASQHMVALGLEADVPESAIRAEKIPGEYLFTRPGTQRIIELHTEHTFRHYPRPMPIQDLYNRSRSLPLEGRQVPALSLEDELLLNCIHGAKHFWERLMWVADVAALVTRHPEINWQQAWKAADTVGAQRMLLVGLQLGVTLLGVKLPAEVTERIARDRKITSLCRQIAQWLPLAVYAPPPLLQRARFRMSMGGGGIAGARYLTRLSLSPTEEDWTEGAEDRGFWLWDAIRRPFRLIRKYGQGS
ncbi:MAG: nucleotidyltransferase family protein [Candidatus Acidiferrum sp.]